MDIERLNRSFGAPGRIAFKTGFAGYPEVALTSRYGSAEVALLGGAVLSYKPTGQPQVLFRPARREYNRGESMHGGMPLCWPQFGNRAIPGMGGHGFARVCLFSVRGSEYTEETSEVTLGLKSSDETRMLWPHDFDLELKISVSMKLNATLTTRNDGTEPFSFSAGFHPYFLVRDRLLASVEGLDGCSFVDARDMSEGVQRGTFAEPAACDHVFELKPSPRHEMALVDRSLERAVAVVSSGSGNAVVWNPGAEGEGSVHDLEAGDWRKFLCVEPVTGWPSASTTLKPGESHSLAVAVQSTLGGVDENA